MSDFDDKMKKYADEALQENPDKEWALLFGASLRACSQLAESKRSGNRDWTLDCLSNIAAQHLELVVYVDRIQRELRSRLEVLEFATGVNSADPDGTRHYPPSGERIEMPEDFLTFQGRLSRLEDILQV